MDHFDEAREIALEALKEANFDRDEALDIAHQMCDAHEAAIYHYKGIKFCAEQNTVDGEQFLEDCGGIAREGDSFGTICCRIAYASLYVSACGNIETFFEEREAAE